jgi:hypothetical protein
MDAGWCECPMAPASPCLHPRHPFLASWHVLASVQFFFFGVFLRFLLNTNDTHFSCALEERSINIVILFVSGIALLKVGGRMVYSTCSMNPVENEAVVAEVLIEF